MPNNHYHLLIQTMEGRLSQGMRHLNGVHTQASSRRHRRAEHLFQGRFKGILVNKDAYLLDLCRYLILNPVRAKIVETPEEWSSSSYRATIGRATSPKWLAVDERLRPLAPVREEARRRYRAFASEGIGQRIWERLRQQIYLGDDAFVQRMQSRVAVAGDAATDPRVQRRPPPLPLAALAAPRRDAAMVAAYATGAHCYREIAEYFGVHLATVGRIVRKAMPS